MNMEELIDAIRKKYESEGTRRNKTTAEIRQLIWDDFKGACCVCGKATTLTWKYSDRMSFAALMRHRRGKRRKLACYQCAMALSDKMTASIPVEQRREASNSFPATLSDLRAAEQKLLQRIEQPLRTSKAHRRTANSLAKVRERIRELEGQK